MSDDGAVVPGRYFHAVAVDYDGTLTTSGIPSPDVLAAIAEARADGCRLGLVAAAGALPQSAAAALAREACPGRAVLVDRSRPAGAVVFAVGHRETSHMRHWHKYSAGLLQPERRFYFRRGWDAATGVTAGSIEELEHELRICDDEVIAHHCRSADLSRWIAEVLGDPPLAAAVGEVETAVRAGTTSIAEARTGLTGVIHRRYQG
jgi:hypothetical protein